MSFDSLNLSVLAYANNFTLWHYTTTDRDITVSGYFDNGSSDLLRQGDLIIANVDRDSIAPINKLYIVTKSEAGVVEVAAYS